MILVTPQLHALKPAQIIAGAECIPCNGLGCWVVPLEVKLWVWAIVASWPGGVREATAIEAFADIGREQAKDVIMDGEDSPVQSCMVQVGEAAFIPCGMQFAVLDIRKAYRPSGTEEGHNLRVDAAPFVAIPHITKELAKFPGSRNAALSLQDAIDAIEKHQKDVHWGRLMCIKEWVQDKKENEGAAGDAKVTGGPTASVDSQGSASSCASQAAAAAATAAARG